MKTITNKPEELARQIIEDIYSQMVKHRDQLRVRATPLGKSFTLSVMVHKADHGIALGKQAAHINSIKHLTRLLGNAYGITIEAVLLDPVVGVPGEKAKFEPKDHWNAGPVHQTIRDIGEAIFLNPFKIEIQNAEDYRSNIGVTVDKHENRALVEVLNMILTPLVNAIGKNAGRMLSLTIAAPETKDEPAEAWAVTPGGKQIAKLPGRA